MARVTFTQNIQRHVACPPGEIEGTTVAEVLEGYFSDHCDARAYVLNDQGEVRHHMVIFVDGIQCRDRHSLSDAVNADSEIYVMQALSGGAGQ